MNKITDERMLRPVLTPSGKPWVQRCYLCGKTVNFLKMAWGVEWIRVGNLVRHKKCRPQPAR